PVMLEGPGISKDWLVLFRSHDPSDWDRDVDRGDNRFARPLAAAPENLRHLRLRKDSDFVILELSQGKLNQLTDDGRFGWNGTRQALGGIYQLGIVDRMFVAMD